LTVVKHCGAVRDLVLNTDRLTAAETVAAIVATARTPRQG